MLSSEDCTLPLSLGPLLRLRWCRLGVFKALALDAAVRQRSAEDVLAKEVIAYPRSAGVRGVLAAPS